MNALDVTRINIYAPYKIWSDGDIYRFETDNGIKYLVDFELDSNPYYTAYWFNLTNPEHSKSPGDTKIAQTGGNRPSGRDCSCAGSMAMSSRSVT